MLVVSGLITFFGDQNDDVIARNGLRNESIKKSICFKGEKTFLHY